VIIRPVGSHICLVLRRMHVIAKLQHVPLFESFGYMLDAVALWDSDSTQSRSRREQRSSFTGIIAFPSQHKPCQHALSQSENDIIDRRPSEPPIPRPQIDDEVLVQFFGRYPIPKEESDPNEEEDHSLYHKALDAENIIRTSSDPPSLDDKSSDTQQLYRRTE
jgi:hypothetical protein